MVSTQTLVKTNTLLRHLTPEYGFLLQIEEWRKRPKEAIDVNS
jgi:hypothetical protein